VRASAARSEILGRILKKFRTLERIAHFSFQERLFFTNVKHWS